MLFRHEFYSNFWLFLPNNFNRIRTLFSLPYSSTVWKCQEFCSTIDPKISDLQKLDDHRILLKFLKDSDQKPSLVSNHTDDYGIVQELDDHGIIILDFKDFDQILANLKGQLY